jgi:enterochelin esterase family protein
MPDNPDREARNRELPCHPPFADFLVRELLPWARARYHVTDDPARTIVGGASYGGLAAAFAGLRHPEAFGNILSQSGSFWWKPEGEEEHEWLARQFVDSPTLPLRFYLDVGLLENTYDEAPSQRCVNRHMRDVLRAK